MAHFNKENFTRHGKRHFNLEEIEPSSSVLKGTKTFRAKRFTLPPSPFLNSSLRKDPARKKKETSAEARNQNCCNYELSSTSVGMLAEQYHIFYSATLLSKYEPLQSYRGSTGWLVCLCPRCHVALATFPTKSNSGKPSSGGKRG